MDTLFFCKDGPSRNRPFRPGVTAVGEERVREILENLPATGSGVFADRRRAIIFRGQPFHGQNIFELLYSCGTDHGLCSACYVAVNPYEHLKDNLPTDIVVRIVYNEKAWQDFAQRPEILLQQAIASLAAHGMKSYIIDQTYRGQNGQCGIRIKPDFAIVYFGEEHAISSDLTTFLVQASEWIEGRHYPSLTVQLLNLHVIITDPKSMWRKIRNVR